MKIALTTALLFFFTFTIGFGQLLQAPNRSYGVWIKQQSGPKIKKSHLIRLMEDSIVISPTYVEANKLAPTTFTIPISNINQIKVRRKDNIGRSILIGLSAGAALGASMGYALGDDFFTAGQKAIGLGVFFGVVGSVVGGIAGIPGKSFRIYGDPLEWQKAKVQLEERLKWEEKFLVK